MPQLEKNQEVLPSRRDEALFHCGISRKITPSLLKLERDLHNPAANQEFPRHTRLHLRGTPRVAPNSKGALFPPPPLKMRVPFPASSGKDSRHSRSISRGGALNRNVERNCMGGAIIPKDSQMSQSTPDEPDFPALPRPSPRVSTHTTVALETAL